MSQKSCAHTYTLRPELGLITYPTLRKHIMIFWVIIALLQEVLAVAGVGECNISYVFTQNKQVPPILRLYSFVSDLSVCGALFYPFCFYYKLKDNADVIICYSYCQ